MGIQNKIQKKAQDLEFFSFALQALVVITSDWDTFEGKLYCFQRSSLTATWETFSEPINVTLGQKGIAWGKGLHDSNEVKGLFKKEGDYKSPAGIFRVGLVFGDAIHKHYAKKMFYQQIEDDWECVDDPNSVYYNHFIYRRHFQDCDWKTSEVMSKVGFQYDLGTVIEHNMDPVEAGKGSAIFMHIWGAEKKGTAGCTAMSEKDLISVITWLDNEKKPCLIQLPIKEYNQRQQEWDLPILLPKEEFGKIL